MAAPTRAIAAADATASTLTVGAAKGPVKRTSSAICGISIGMPCRTRGRIERSSVSFLKSSVPLIDTSISFVSMAIERSTCATPPESGNRITAHCELGGRLDRAERIDGLGQAIERETGIELRVDERRRAHHCLRPASDAAHPLVRRVAAHRDVDRHGRLAAAHLARHAGGGEQRREVEIATVELERDGRRLAAGRIDRHRAGDRAAVARRLHARRVELPVGKRESGSDPFHRAAPRAASGDRSQSRRSRCGRAARRTKPGRR